MGKVVWSGLCLVQAVAWALTRAWWRRLRALAAFRAALRGKGCPQAVAKALAAEYAAVLDLPGLVGSGRGEAKQSTQ